MAIIGTEAMLQPPTLGSLQTMVSYHAHTMGRTGGIPIDRNPSQYDCSGPLKVMSRTLHGLG